MVVTSFDKDNDELVLGPHDPPFLKVKNVVGQPWIVDARCCAAMRYRGPLGTGFSWANRTRDDHPMAVSPQTGSSCVGKPTNTSWREHKLHCREVDIEWFYNLAVIGRVCPNPLWVCLWMVYPKTCGFPVNNDNYRMVIKLETSTLHQKQSSVYDSPDLKNTCSCESFPND